MKIESWENPCKEHLSPKECILELFKEKMGKKSKDLDNSIQIIIKQSKRDTRFIDEMIQNADDANASKIVFTLKNDSIMIENNGKEFNERDVYSICSIDSSKTDQATIGILGVGFKSIFRITQKPIIKSGFYHFYIKDFLYPYWIEDNKFQKGAIFHVQFERSFLRKVNDVSLRLFSLRPQLLLFLENLKEIRIVNNIDDSILHYKCSLDNKTDTTNFSVKQFCIQEYIEKKEEKWIVFSRSIEIPGHLKEYREKFSRILKKRSLQINLAFKKNTSLQNLEESDLFVFLPVHETKFSFLLNGDFITNSSRDDLDENNWNKYVLIRAASFYFEIIKFCIGKYPFGIDLYRLIPNKDQVTRRFLEYFQEEFVRQLTTKSIIPLRTPSLWTSSERILIPSDPKFYELLTDEDIQQIFPEYNGFIHPSLQKNVPIFQEIEINVLDLKDFLEALIENRKFFTSKGVEWWIKFFVYLADYKIKNIYWDSSQFEILCKEKNIIQTIDKDFKTSLDLDIPIFYLNKKDLLKKKKIYSSIRKQGFGTFIHEKFYKYAEEEFSEEIRDYSLTRLFKFLENYELVQLFNHSNLVKYGIVSRLKQLNPQNYKDFVSIRKIWMTIVNQWSEDKNSFNPEDLSKQPIFPTFNAGADGKRLLKPIIDCYIKSNKGSTELWDVFSGIDGIYFEVDLQIKSREKWEDFLNLAGIHSTIIIETRDWRGSEIALKKRGIDIFSNKYGKDRYSPSKGFHIQRDKRSVHIEKFFSCIPEFSIEVRTKKIRLLINHLSKHWDEYRRHLEGELQWHYYGRFYENVETEFSRALKENKWVPIEGKLYFPKALILKNKILADTYVSDNLIFPFSISEVMAEDLGIKKFLNIPILLNILHNEISQDTPDKKRINLILEHLNEAYISDGKSEQVLEEIYRSISTLPIIADGNKFYSLSNTFTRDQSPFFGADRAYLEKNYKKNIIMFCQKLGVKDSPSLTDFIDYLKHISEELFYEDQVDSQLQIRLWRIFKYLNENKKYEQLPKEKIKEFLVPTHSQGFLRCSDVFYNDNNELSDIFKNEVPFFINITLHESMLDFFEWCGLKSISRFVKVKLTVLESNSISSKVEKIILSSLKALKIIQRAHDDKMGEIIKEDLTKLKIYITSKITVEYILNDPSITTVSSYIMNKDIYFCKDRLNLYIKDSLIDNGFNWTNIAFELSKINKTPSLICSFELLFQKAKDNHLLVYLKNLDMSVKDLETESLDKRPDEVSFDISKKVTEDTAIQIENGISISKIEVFQPKNDDIINKGQSVEILVDEVKNTSILKNELKVISREYKEPQIEGDPSSNITIEYIKKEIDEVPADIRLMLSPNEKSLFNDVKITHSREETEEFGTILVRKFEELNKRIFYDLRKKSGIGYDFYSKNGEGAVERRIEMKTFSKTSSSVSLTIRELSSMQKYKDEYISYILLKIFGRNQHYL